MGPGGAERVAATTANHWARDRDVTLITRLADVRDFYPLDERIERVTLRAPRPTTPLRLAKLVRELRNAIEDSRPDVVVSHLTTANVLTLLATSRPAIVVEHVHMRSHRVRPQWALGRRFFYRRARAVVVPSAQPGAVVIPNPVVVPATNGQSGGMTGAATRIVAMGRLTPQKGFDLLLDAFARVDADCSLLVIGDGPERDALENRAKQLGLGGRVAFAGLVPDPTATLLDSHVFALSSRYEGFGLALAEAMACGLAVVAFDCPVGPSDLIEDDVNGLLVRNGDVAAFAAALQQLVSDPERRIRLGSRARSVADRFSPERVMSMWDELLGSVAAVPSG